MIKELIYLYCVSQKGPNLKGLDGGNIYYVHHHGIYAVVSKVSEDEFSEENLKKNLSDIEWIKAKVKIHENVIERIIPYSSVIPFKFGTIFNTEDNLKGMLEEYIERFNDNLMYLDSKEEWGVKIYCDIDRLKKRIIKEDGEILKIEEEINLSSPGKGYFLKKKRDELIREGVNKRINEYSQVSFEILKELSSDERINKLLPKEVTERKEEMVLNSAFLVEKERVLEFVQAVDGLNTRYNNNGLNLDYTGPWPPYNFVGELMS